ncbi:PAS domain-containing protein [Pacificimonas aurantium]|uniref:PAS domain-containing protein n=1 Tax=Pacificimonas aurantium TaxID=1250540 RepID=A0ABS7WPL0_9SPHN|nr:PAS domain-containing protein [Pacificimonas aurantium]
MEALRDFFSAIPPDIGAAFVVLQHLAPDHESRLSDILGRVSSIPVEDAEDGQAICIDHVYVLPPDKALTIVDSGLFIEPRDGPDNKRLVIDHFMRSLATVLGPRAVGVVLSGTGSDGSLGLREIRAEGGLTAAQSPETALYDGMPASAVAMGTVDFVGPIAAIADRIVSFAKDHRDGNGEHSISTNDLNSITALLRARAGLDFSSYKRGTIERRVLRRLSLLRFTDMGDYLAYLRSTPPELQQLAGDLLINVTGFFRDPEVWTAVRERAIDPMVSKADPAEHIRIWVPAASTGEEAFTLAILLDEACRRQNKEGLSWQIFATDVDAEAVATARHGAYPTAIEQDLTPERLKRYFTSEGKGYRVAKRLRERVVFAEHNLLSDPPFSRLSMVSCRNLLIYLSNTTQARLFDVFHFGLEDDGFLLLGTSETTSQRQKLFKTVDQKAHLYQRKQGPGRASQLTSHPAGGGGRIARPTQSYQGEFGRPRTANIGEATRRGLLRRYSPPAAAVSADGDVAYFHGDVRDFLIVPEGEPTQNLVHLLPAGLRRRFTEAISAAEDSRDGRAEVSGVRRGDEQPYRIEIERLRETSDPALFLCAFIQESFGEPEIERPGKQDPANDDDEYLGRLEHELLVVKEDLQTTVEELETSNEELKAANEESTAANEELQSTNEELETSREELQSLNEELVTVNSQLEEKVREVESTTNDLENLLNSTRLAVLFLDVEHRIRSFTPASDAVVELRDGDVGRPLADLKMKVEDEQLYQDIEKVLSQLTPMEREVAALNGDAWFLRRIQPYRGAQDRIEGVVITYNDITNMALATRQLALRERQQSAIAEMGEAALLARSMEDLYPGLLRPLHRLFEADGVKILRLSEDGHEFTLVAGIGWDPADIGHATVVNSPETQAGYTARHGPVATEDVTEDKRFGPPELLKRYNLRAGLSAPILIDGRAWGVVGAHSRQRERYNGDDLNVIRSAANILAVAIGQITRERTAVEEKVRRDLAFRAADLAFWRHIPETDEAEWDRKLPELLGQDPETFSASGNGFFSAVHPDDVSPVREAYTRTVDRGEPFEMEFRIVLPSGNIRWIAGRGARIPGSDPLEIMGVNFDVTDRRKQEERQDLIMRELDHRVKNMLSVIVSVAQISSRQQTDLQSFVETFTQRVQAMAKAHSLISEGKWDGVDLAELLETELGQYEQRQGANILISGARASLTPEAAQSLSLAVHELATNAAKYGALSVPEGQLRVRWHHDPRAATLVLDWRERGGPPVKKPRKKGFGSRVIDRIASSQLGADIEQDFQKEGLCVTITMPDHHLSVPPTSGRQQVELGGEDGGLLPDLKGRKVMVLDDEWLIAENNSAILIDAGCDVVGPITNLPEAEAHLDDDLDAAVLDVNIAGQTSLDLARKLHDKGVPFLFVSGYRNLVEKDIDAPILAKPVVESDLLSCLRKIIKGAEDDQG